MELSEVGNDRGPKLDRIASHSDQDQKKICFRFTMDKFFAIQAKKKQGEDEPNSDQSLKKSGEGRTPPNKLPKGVVLGKDGKP